MVESPPRADPGVRVNAPGSFEKKSFKHTSSHTAKSAKFLQGAYGRGNKLHASLYGYPYMRAMLRSALMRINKTGKYSIIQLPCSFGRVPVLGSNVLWGIKAGLLSSSRASTSWS